MEMLQAAEDTRGDDQGKPPRNYAQITEMQAAQQANKMNNAHGTGELIGVILGGGVGGGCDEGEPVKVPGKVPGKLINMLPFWVSVLITGACLITVFIVGILRAFEELDMDYKIQVATGLSLGIALMDVLKERVVTLTNHNLKHFEVPGHDFFQVGREIALAWLWLPLSWLTYHPATTVGVFLEMFIAAGQTMISAIKPEDVAETWARAFIITGLGVSVPGIIYCFILDYSRDKTMYQRVAGHWSRLENFFAKAERSKWGRLFLKAVKFLTHGYEAAKNLQNYFKSPSADVTSVAVHTANFGTDENVDLDFSPADWQPANAHDDGAVPVFPPGEEKSEVPNPRSFAALAMPVVGLLGSLASITLYSMLFHDIYADDLENRYFRTSNAALSQLKISEHAVSAAQLLMVVGWMALSVVAGMAYTDLTMKASFDDIKTQKVGQRKGFDWIREFDRVKHLPVVQKYIDKAYSYPSEEEFKAISESPSGVVEGIPRIFKWIVCIQDEPKMTFMQFFAAVWGNIAKYFIVARALIFATYDNDNQGFLLWYVVPEGIAIILLIAFFYRQSWDVSMLVRGKPEYKKRRLPPTIIPREEPVQPIEVHDPPPQIWVQRGPGGGVAPLEGYGRGPTVPNRPVGDGFGLVPGVPLPMSMYAEAPTGPQVGLPRLVYPAPNSPFLFGTAP